MPGASWPSPGGLEPSLSASRDAGPTIDREENRDEESCYLRRFGERLARVLTRWLRLRPLHSARNPGDPMSAAGSTWPIPPPPSLPTRRSSSGTDSSFRRREEALPSTRGRSSGSPSTVGSYRRVSINRSRTARRRVGVSRGSAAVLHQVRMCSRAAGMPRAFSSSRSRRRSTSSARRSSRLEPILSACAHDRCHPSNRRRIS